MSRLLAFLACLFLACAAPAYAQVLLPTGGCAAGIQCNVGGLNFPAPAAGAAPTNGFYLTGTNQVQAYSNGVARWMTTAGGNLSNVASISNLNANGYQLISGQPSATVPNYVTNHADLTTGLGGVINHAALIASATNVFDCISTLCTQPVPIKYTGTIPTVTGTGTPTITTGSTDTAGEVTGGTLATSIIITFSSTKTNAPFCAVTSQTAPITYTISTTAITIALTATTGEKINYVCAQH